MTKYFLVNSKNENIESGSLIKSENENLIIIHPKNCSLPEDCIISDNWIELSEIKMNYLLKRDLTKRLAIYQSNLFERIEKLKPFDECYIMDGRYRERCTIIERKNQENKFLVKLRNKKEKIISILDIDLIVIIEYFICLSKYGGIEAGMIIIDEDNTRKTYPDGYFVCNFIDKLSKISREEAIFLCKYPCEERLKIHSDKLWERINRLTVGDRCCLVSKLDHPSYEIIGKNVLEDGVEYIVQSIVGYMVCVDQSEIRPGNSVQSRQTSLEGMMSFRTAMDRSVNTRIRISSEDENSLVSQTAFFESTVIDPRSVITIEQISSDEWAIDADVEFHLGESYTRFSGQLKWMGMINKVMSAVIQVDSVATGDPIRQYICSYDILQRLNLSSIDNMIMVLLATVTRSKTLDECEYLKSISRFIKSKELVGDVLMNAIMTEDTRVLKYVVEYFDHPINLERYPDLLPTLIRLDHYDLIARLLKHLITSVSDNVHLLNVAKYFLLIDDFQTFLAASKKCTDVNFVLDTGETFLTDILKDCIDESVINRVIGSNMFDVNKTNADGDSPLVLACRKLMVSTVRLMLANGAVMSYQNHMALNTVTDLRNNNSDMIQLQRALEIIAIFTKEIRLDYNICTICMDRRINTALNCGHTMCDFCSNQLFNCPECNREVIERIRIFLP